MTGRYRTAGNAAAAAGAKVLRASNTSRLSGWTPTSKAPGGTQSKAARARCPWLDTTQSAGGRTGKYAAVTVSMIGGFTSARTDGCATGAAEC